MGGGEENNDTKIIETFEEGEIEKKRDKWAAILLLFYSVKVALSNSRWINETNSLKRFHTDDFINKMKTFGFFSTKFFFQNLGFMVWIPFSGIRFGRNASHSTADFGPSAKNPQRIRRGSEKESSSISQHRCESFKNAEKQFMKRRREKIILKEPQKSRQESERLPKVSRIALLR